MEKSGLKILVLIPARGSSKSIKFKSLTKIKGRSILEISFNVVKNLGISKNIFCSTESKKIENVCKKIGLKVIKRPKHLSKDNTNVFYVAKHAINYLKKKKKFFDYILLLQATYLFLNKKDITGAINKLNNKNFTSCLTLHRTPHMYHYLNTRIIKGNIVKFKFNKLRVRKYNKQKKDVTYHFGNLVITKIKSFLKEKTFFTKRSTFFIINRFSSFDLDDKNDLNYLKNFK